MALVIYKCMYISADPNAESWQSHGGANKTKRMDAFSCDGAQASNNGGFTRTYFEQLASGNFIGDWKIRSGLC